MTYQTGFSILASDYNNLAGETAYNQAYGSSVLATNKTSAIYGVGYGDRGYGQNGINLPVKNANEKVQSTDWTLLLDTITACSLHSGADISMLPNASFFTSGQSIVPANSGLTHLSNSIASINNSRLNTSIGSTTLFSNVLTMTRSTTWSGDITGSINVTFSSDNAARFFFNSGGQIRFLLSHPNGSTPQNTSWLSTLSNIGIISFSAHNTARAGTLGVPSAIGYYESLSSDLLILNGENLGNAGYTTNDTFVYVRNNGTSVNGSKGFTLTFTFTLQDQHTNAWSDLVASGTNVTVSVLKATTYLTSIETPTVSILSNW